MGHVEAVLHHKHIGIEYLAFVFPERWLSVHEQHHFLSSLDKHPEVVSKRITKVDVLTQNALLIGGCNKGEIIKFDLKDSRGLLEDELRAVAKGGCSADEIYARIAEQKEE